MTKKEFTASYNRMLKESKAGYYGMDEIIDSLWTIIELERNLYFIKGKVSNRKSSLK